MIDNLHNDNFCDLIRGKSVAIVGPASYMENSNFGCEIDSYDLVARINRSTESVSEWSIDIGSRTDILYSCLIEKPENAGIIDVESLSNDHSVRYVCAPPKSTFEGISRANILSDLVSQKKVKDISERIPFRIVDYKLNNMIAESVKCRPNTGLLAIYDILDNKPKKLGIYGFSFYLDGFLKGTKKGASMSERDFANKCFNSKRHKQRNLWKYAKDTLLENKFVYLDPHLKAILSMEQFGVEEFTKR